MEDVPPFRDDRSAIYVPWTPAATFGQVYVVASSRIKALDMPLTEMMGPVTE